MEKVGLGNQFSINGREIGKNRDVYIIAEMSANHAGDFDTAVQIIKAAHDAGADAIKLQTYTADTITLDCDSEVFKIKQGTIWDGKTLHELYKEAHMPWEWQPKLKTVADKIGIDLFSSPFDDTAVDFLEQIQVPAYKIASFEMNDTGLLRKVARTGQPVIFSTGMASTEEIQLALKTLQDAGAQQIAMLKCTSAYPAMPGDMNLRTIADMRQKFGIEVGLSDHTMGIEVPVVAVALGASIIEKHLTLSRDIESADSKFSLEPHEFAAMVRAVRNTTRALGQIHYGSTERDRNNRNFRRSLFVVKPVAAGDTFSEQNVRSIRPGSGLEPVHLDEIIGRQAKESIEAGTPLVWKHVA